MPNNVELDEVDQMIVQQLLADGRLSIPQLAERVGIGRATAYARFDRLVDDGVLAGFTATVDPEAVGLGVAALILITADQGDWPDLQARILDATGVQWLGLGAGVADFVALVRARDLAELRDVVLRQLLSLPGIRSTQTTVLLDEVRADGAVL